MSHFNVSLIVWAKSQDSAHKPPFLKRRERRAEADRTKVLLLTSQAPSARQHRLTGANPHSSKFQYMQSLWVFPVLSLTKCVCVCVCARACGRVCVRVPVCVCARARVHVCVRKGELTGGQQCSPRRTEENCGRSDCCWSPRTASDSLC